MEKNNTNELVIASEEKLKDKIYVIRGQKVMLDFELAYLYGYETKRFNEQIRNNIERFDEDFRFKLTKEEWENWRSNFSTSSWGGARYLPHAFTEQGIYMLMAVLKGDVAINQSKTLIRTFKLMKDYIIENQNLIDQRQYLQLSIVTAQNSHDIADISHNLQVVEEQMAEVVNELGEVVKKSDISDIMIDFGNLNVRKSILLLKGQLVEANLGYMQIYEEAKQSIYVIDNYIGLKTLVLLKAVSSSIPVTIISDNIGGGLHKLEYEDFHKEYFQVNIDFKRSCGEFHDRYIILDYGTENEKIFHCGGSSKDAGFRVMTIEEVPDKDIYHELIDRVCKNPPLRLI